MMRMVSFVFFSLAVMADKGKIKVQSRTVTLTCPEGTNIRWTQSGNISNSDRNEYSFTYGEDKTGILYYCISDGKKYSFYFKGKVCEHCFELDGMLLITIIIGDLLVTGGVIFLTYHQAQRKSRPPPAAAANHQEPSREPESNYEDLSPRTRDNAVYAGVHRTG